MANAQTKLANLVNPEVMADMISAKLPKKIKFSPIAKIDTTLVGRAGDTVTVPKYAYIGDAEDVAEGVAMGTTVLTASTIQVKVKKAGKAVELTDEAVLSGYGDPKGEATSQLTMAIAAKVDNDCLDALYEAPLKYDGSAGAIGYEGLVKADAVFESESDEVLNKVLYINPLQEQTIRLDPNFMDKNKYGLELVMNGAIGKIAGMEVKKSKKVKKNEGGTGWLNPIVILAAEDPNEASDADGTAEEAPALTIYMKRNVEVETDRDILAKTTVVSADEHYGVALSNESKVVVATFAV
jgi:N4-gp56 family major capsid protein